MDQMHSSNKDNLIPIVKNGTGLDNSKTGDEKIILNTSEIQIVHSFTFKMRRHGKSVSKYSTYNQKLHIST